MIEMRVSCFLLRDVASVVGELQTTDVADKLNILPQNTTAQHSKLHQLRTPSFAQRN